MLPSLQRHRESDARSFCSPPAKSPDTAHRGSRLPYILFTVMYRCSSACSACERDSAINLLSLLSITEPSQWCDCLRPAKSPSPAAPSPSTGNVCLERALTLETSKSSQWCNCALVLLHIRSVHRRQLQRAQELSWQVTTPSQHPFPPVSPFPPPSLLSPLPRGAAAAHA